MKQSQEHLQDSVFAYVQPAFQNTSAKYGITPIIAEAHAACSAFTNSADRKLTPDARIPTNPLSAEQLATGLAVSYQTSTREWA